MIVHLDAINGEAIYTYLTNKHKGGKNNSKGNSYENHFAIYTIARLFNEKRDRTATFLSAQQLCFVDDLVVEERTTSQNSYYQIKDVVQLDWKNGIHPLEADFNMQKNICNHNHHNSDMNLVLSRSEVHASMVSTLPETIRAFTNIIHFETAPSVSMLVRTNTKAKTELTKMCALNNPGADKLETLATIILGAWDATNKVNINLENLLNHCHDTNPHYIRGHANQIPARVKVLIQNIKGFTFEVQNGYITWRYELTDSGVVSAAIGSLAFNQWENEILEYGKFDNFEDLEPFLY